MYLYQTFNLRMQLKSIFQRQSRIYLEFVWKPPPPHPQHFSWQKLLKIFFIDTWVSGMSPKFLSKTTPPGQRILSKNTKISTQRQGSYVKCSYPEAMLFALSIHRDQTRQKNCTSLSLRKTEIILPINSTKSNSHKSKTQLMRGQEANILLLLNSIKYNMLSFHSGDVGQIARPREREKPNISILGRVHKVQSHSLGHDCLIKIPTTTPNPRDNIDRCITKRYPQKLYKKTLCCHKIPNFKPHVLTNKQKLYFIPKKNLQN